MRELLSDEVDAVSGAWAAPLAGAAIGAVSAMAGYYGGAATSGANPPAAGMLGAAVTGAIGGAMFPPASAWAARALVVPQVGFYGGMAGGAVIRGLRAAQRWYRTRMEPGNWRD